MRSGGPLVVCRRSLQANQALEPLEAEFNAPSQPVEGKDVSRCEVLWLERGYQDHPICGIECLSGELMASLLRRSPRPASRSLGSLRRLLDGNQTRSERRRT